MNMKSRNLIVSLVIILFLLISVLFFFFRVTDNQVIVNKMSGFNEVLPDSERVIVDKGDVQQFTYAVRFADKQQGEVDISAPPFKFTLGKKQYYLWISETYSQGTLMKLPNTGTIYKIDESRVSKLLKILHKKYENNTVIQ
ncbi:hypothetical protein [Paenibacillus endoradicis]|uniref:hypothetical protein n=1 Tax=Paenibacillus endoradicis TaxID=2972487 RepID=UPI002159AC52|nr:hypothetical protein [Paenibacillus endoradicis]MCR8656804.1 hypothetical protein [Paenibacillus endoradicis]